MQKEVTRSFIESISEVFGNMLDCSVQLKKEKADNLYKDNSFVIGVIGLSGTAQAVIALSFSEQAALKTVGQMAGCEYDSIDSTVADGVGELVNMIVGNAKAKLESHSLSISLPSVFKGNLCKIQWPVGVDYFDIHFTSKYGDFNLAVAFKEMVPGKKEVMNVNTGS